MENYENVMRLVSSNKNVLGVAPFVLGQVLVETEPVDTNTSVARRRALAARRGRECGKFRERAAQEHRRRRV